MDLMMELFVNDGLSKPADRLGMVCVLRRATSGALGYLNSLVVWVDMGLLGIRAVHLNRARSGRSLRSQYIKPLDR